MIWDIFTEGYSAVLASYDSFKKELEDYPSLIFTLKILLVIGLTIFAIKKSGRLIDRIFNFKHVQIANGETYRKLIRSVSNYIIIAIAIVTILRIMKIDISGLLAGAGIFGLALGIGAQSLIRDILTGMFLLSEHQVVVGDYVRVNDKFNGTIEEVGVRVTKLREYNGRIHYIPNGTITHVANYNRNNMRAVVPLTLPFEVDIEKALKTLNEVGERINLEQGESIIEKSEVVGITNIDQHGVTFTITAVTSPDDYWMIAREIRKEAIIGLQKAGLEFAYPRSILYHSDTNFHTRGEA